MNPTVHIPAASVPPRKKRRWWLWGLAALGCIVLLTVAGFLGLAHYYHLLIDRHTQTHALVLAPVDTSQAAREELNSRLSAFHLALVDGRQVRPLRLTPEDLDVLIAGVGEIKDFVRFQMEDRQLQAVFSVPLGKKNQPELKGRYLNGVAHLNLQRGDDAFLTVRVEQITANGKPIPHWLLSKIQRHDLLGFLDNNRDYLEFLARLDHIEITRDAIEFVPYPDL